MAGGGKRDIGRRLGALDGPRRPGRCPGCGRVVPARTRVYLGVKLGWV